jgi:hypothetical protein
LARPPDRAEVAVTDEHHVLGRAKLRHAPERTTLGRARAALPCPPVRMPGTRAVACFLDYDGCGYDGARRPIERFCAGNRQAMNTVEA